MTARRVTLGLCAAILFGIAALFFATRSTRVDAGSSAARRSSAPTMPAPASSVAIAQQNPHRENSSSESNPRAEQLNAANGNIRHDLDVLNNLFVNFQTNFPGRGNPVGENSEITAALTGANPIGFAFLPKDHPAINAAGELCDRWGTPFRFHQLSGTQMEIRSAGPDRKFGTADDAEFAPWSK